MTRKCMRQRHAGLPGNNKFKVSSISEINKCLKVGYKKVPVKSPSTMQATSAKCRQLVEAMLAATGSMSPMCVHKRAVYFFSKEPTPISSGP